MAQQQPAPSVGEVIDGYRFKGGDPAQQSSWEPAEPPGARLLPRGRATGDRRSEEAYWGRRRTQGDPAVTQAEQGVAASRRAEGLLARQEAQGQGTGGIYGIPFIGPVAGFLDPEIRELNALQARQARLERQPGEGAISDFDAAQFVAMTYGADKPMDTNRALIQAQRVINDATLQKREFDEWYFGQYGTTAGSQEAWRVYAQENPIFDPASQRGEGPAQLNRGRQNWRQYFTGEQGLDTQAEIDAAATAGTDEFGLPEYGIQGGREIDVRPAGPGSSAQSPIDLTTASREEVIAAIQRGGWFRQGPDGEPYELPASTPEFGAQPGDEMVSPGVAVRPRINSDRALQERIEDGSGVPGWWRGIEAFAQGAAEQFPGLDEAAAWTAAKLAGVDYEEARNVQRDVSQYDRANYGAQRNIGGVSGAVAQIPVGMGAAGALPQVLRQAPRVAGATVGADRLRRGANALRAAGTGMAAGAVYGAGAGEGGAAERGFNALEGAAIGGVLGPVVEPIARPVIGAVRGIGDAARQVVRPNALESAAGTYASRFNPDTNALAARADELESLGTQPAFIDLVDDARLGTFRAINTRDTPAREAGTRLAETRRRNLPSRVRQIAGEEISGETRPTLEVIDELSATRRANAQEGMADFGGQQVTLNENAVQAVRSDMARNAIRDAAIRAQASLDPVERASAARLNQLADMALDNPAATAMTVREAQDVSAALNAAADGAYRSATPANGPVLSELARAIRSSARQSSEGYDNWLRQYADDSQLLEAATTGRNFVQAAPDPISERGTDAFVRNAAGATPPELAVQRAAARQAMEAAGAGPTGARSVLEGFASNQDQARRAAAIGADPARLQARADAELRMVQNAQNVSPRVDSQTGTNVADQAAEVAGTARDVMTGNMPGVVSRVGRRLMSRGFSDQQAEAIGLAALDPTRTREVIDLLATRMNRQEARSLLRAIRFSAAQQSGQYAGDDE